MTNQDRSRVAAELVRKTEKRGSASKKYRICSVTIGLLAAFLLTSLHPLVVVEAEVQWLAVFFLGVLGVGYVLGVAGLEAVVSMTLGRMSGWTQDRS